MRTQGTIQAPLCLNGMGNWQIPVPGDYLHSSRIQTSGIAFAASVLTLSTGPSLRTRCCFSRWASTDPTSPQLSPPPCNLPGQNGDGLGCTSSAAHTDPLHPHSLSRACFTLCPPPNLDQPKLTMWKGQEMPRILQGHQEYRSWS